MAMHHASGYTIEAKVTVTTCCRTSLDKISNFATRLFVNVAAPATCIFVNDAALVSLLHATP